MFLFESFRFMIFWVYSFAWHDRYIAVAIRILGFVVLHILLQIDVHHWTFLFYLTGIFLGSMLLRLMKCAAVRESKLIIVIGLEISSASSV